MDEDLNPDHRAFAAHCYRLLAAGCHGLSVFGTTGEANSLSVDERLAALEALVEGGVSPERLLPGTGSCALTATVLLQGCRRRWSIPILRRGRRARQRRQFAPLPLSHPADDRRRPRVAPDLTPHRRLPRRGSRYEG